MGEIHATLGPVFGGKSKALQHKYRSMCLANPTKTICLIPAIDTRYSSGELNVSHDGTRISAKRVSNLTEDPPGLEQAEYIFVDEAQFIPGFAQFCLRQLDKGKKVYFSALNADYLGRPWPEVQALVPALVTSCTILSGVCVACHGPAYYSRRLDATNDALIDIGSDDKYVVTCRAHWKPEFCITAEMLESRARVLLQLSV
jgi:thymidine kinase